MSIITLVEYERVPIRAELETVDDHALSTSELDALYGVSARLGIEIFQQTGRAEVRFQQYVGLIRLGRRNIELLPKIESPTDKGPTLIRENLLRMLLIARDVDVHLPSSVLAELAHVNWLDALVRLFCLELSEQIRRGLTRRYRLEEDDLHVVRGRILVEQQVTRNIIHRERIACEFDELDENHALNQLFKLALSRMLRLIEAQSVQREVRELLVSFGAVELKPLSEDWWKRVELDRLATRFEPTKNMAQMFLSGLSPDLAGGRDDSFALLFDMNELFEGYIGRQLRQRLALERLTVKLQEQRHYLVRALGTGVPLIKLKPDIVVRCGTRTECVADTKWKRLWLSDSKFGLKENDIYQMLAYAQGYRCDHLLMLYPYHGEAGDVSGLVLEYEGRPTSVVIGQIRLDDLRTVPAQLASLYHQAIGAAPAATSEFVAVGTS